MYLLYHTKGSDRCQVNIGNSNEIDKYVQGRYVSACESAWRIFKFPLQNHSPTVYRLALHLPEQHRVTFDATETEINLNQPILDMATDQGQRENRRRRFEGIVERNNDTTLMAYFKLNQINPEARNILYRDIPKFYSFNKKDKKWVPRIRPKPNAVGRIYSVHARDIERFALRILLNHVRGAESFEQLKSVNNIQHNTFRQAAEALGLLEDSQEAINCLNEAYLMIANPQRFRKFFCQYIINCSPNVGQIWHRFKDALSEDYLYAIRRANNDFTIQNNEDIYLMTIATIKKLLQEEGYELVSLD